MVASGELMMQTSSPLVNPNWAEFSAVGFEAQDAFGEGEFGDSMSKKSVKKKKKKSDRSEASVGGKEKKKKKKTKSRSKSDDEGEEFGNKLFEKAMAKAQSEEQAALSEAFADMCEDQEFVNAFDGGSTAGESANFASFDANFGAGVMPEQAPKQRTIREDSEGDTGEWLVDNNSKGAQMKEYSRRRASVSHSIGSQHSQSGQSLARSVAHQGSARQAQGAQMSSSQSQPGMRAGSVATGSTSGSMVDFSSYQLDVDKANKEQEEMQDSGTINSEITGLTGVFSTMPSNFEEDESESLSGDEEVLNYPQYDAAASKFAMMQSHAKKKNKPKYKVKYGSVTVREFDRILGDSPAVKTGAPISIGWNVQSVKTHPTPEAHDESRGRPAYTSTQMVLNRDQRHALLMDLGYSQRDIAQAVRATIKTKNKRRTTVNNLGVANVEEKMQSVSSGLKRMLFLKKGDK